MNLHFTPSFNIDRLCKTASVLLFLVYIWKWSSAHALGGVSGVASFITTDEQLQKTEAAVLVQAMLAEGFPFISLISKISFYKQCVEH